MLPFQYGQVTNVAAMGGLTLPAGAVGVWYMDQAQVASMPYYVPNAVAAAPSLNNLVSAPRRLFASTLWSRASITTVTDNFAADPDGATEATRIAWGSADAHVSLTGSLAAGMYTMGVNVKRNSGSDQSFRIGEIANATYTTQTATASWQRFSKTFVHAGGTIQPTWVRSVDSATPADILIVGATINPGASDLGEDTRAGHLRLGRASFIAADIPALSGGALAITNLKYSIAQLPAARSVSAMTIIALASKTTNVAGLSAALSSTEGAGDYALATLFFDNSTIEADFNEANVALAGGGTGLQYADFTQFYQKGYHAFGMRYGAGVGDFWLDDIPLFTRTISKTAVTLQDFQVGKLWNSGAGPFYGNYTIHAVAWWDRKLTDAEYRQALTVLQSRAAAFSISITPARILVGEGDSITRGVTGATNGGFVKLFAANASPVCYGFNNAINGSALADLTSRAAVLDAVLPLVKGTRKLILFVLDGQNDLHGSPSNATVDAWLTSYAAYLDARRAAGWLVIVATLLPSTVTGFNTARGRANPEIASWATSGSIVPGKHADYVCDFGADATMGPDAAASDVSLYSDGTHPTNAGNVNLEPILRAVVNAI